MDLICYAASDYPERAAYLARLEAEAPVDRFETYQTPEELQSGLLRPLGDVLAVVLFLTDDADLSRILTLQDLMDRTRIILVLPAWDPQLVTGGHSLRPRFMTTLEQDFCEVRAVLHKMASNFGCPTPAAGKTKGGNIANGQWSLNSHLEG